MYKLLYSQTTQQTHPYPRNDDAPIVGLDPDFLILEQVETTPPTYDPETEIITPNWVVDITALEYRQEWVVSDKPVPEPVPNWTGFYDGLIVSQTYNHLLGLTVPYPSISGVMAVMGVSLLQGQSDPSNPSRLAALQAAVSAILSVLSALEISLTTEQLTEVRGLLDENGFNEITLG
jgi:hypothetical protein